MRRNTNNVNKGLWKTTRMFVTCLTAENLMWQEGLEFRENYAGSTFVLDRDWETPHDIHICLYKQANLINNAVFVCWMCCKLIFTNFYLLESGSTTYNAYITNIKSTFALNLSTWDKPIWLLYFFSTFQIRLLHKWYISIYTHHSPA